MTGAGLSALTHKEKEALRLIVRGHDAKSVARHLGRSVHTVNERLRDARRKLAVSSSREAARLLFEAECAAAADENAGDTLLGGAGAAAVHQSGVAPAIGAGAALRPRTLLLGVLMTVLLLGLALVVTPQLATPAPQPTSAEAPKPDVVATARHWLELVDAGDWPGSYRATGASFRALNTEAVWAAASTRVRVPLGALKTRVFASEQYLPAPPQGYEVVKFRTSFANKADAEETVTLNREDGAWRVVGITVG